jgi:hypothetical protein
MAPSRTLSLGPHDRPSPRSTPAPATTTPPRRPQPSSAPPPLSPPTPRPSSPAAPPAGEGSCSAGATTPPHLRTLMPTTTHPSAPPTATSSFGWLRRQRNVPLQLRRPPKPHDRSMIASARTSILALAATGNGVAARSGWSMASPTASSPAPPLLRRAMSAPSWSGLGGRPVHLVSTRMASLKSAASGQVDDVDSVGHSGSASRRRSRRASPPPSPVDA